MNQFLRLASLSILAVTATADDQQHANEIDQLIAKVVAADMPYDDYRALFSAAGKDGVRSLKLDDNLSVSLQAAWEEVWYTLTDEQRKQGGNPTDRNALNRFVGFFEGRTRVSVPEWWADLVVRGPSKAKQKWYHNAGPKSVWAPKNTTVNPSVNGYTIKIDDDEIQLPDSILPKSDNGELRWFRVSGLFAPQHVFVAVHDDVGYPHDVACIARTSGKVVWVKRACGCWLAGASGVHESWATVIVHNELVVVFGASWAGFYAHGFNAADGRDKFRFSTFFGPWAPRT